MKNLSLILVLFLITNIGFCQLSIPVTNFKCSAQKSYSLLQSRNNSSDLTQKYDVKFYWHNPEMYLKSQMLKGHTTIRAEVTATQLDTFAFELSDTFTIDSIIYTKNQLPFSRNHDVVFVKLTTALNKGNVFDITIYYHGNTDLSTIDKNWHFPVTFTDSQPYDAIFFFPCKMDLEDKADSVWMFITTSSDCKAGANGLLTKITNLGNGKLRYEWKTKYPTDYYLVAAAVSKYVEYNIWAHPSMTSDSVLVQNFVYDTTQTIGTFTFSCLGLNKAYINNTKYYLELYSDLFGLYPFFKEKYGHCMVALSGAMENQTMTFTGFFDPEIVAHELSHQWFGDYVSCKTWSDIWINEGFADYSEYLADESVYGRDYADSIIDTKHSYIKSLPGGSVYVPSAELWNKYRIFDGRLSYNKGGSIIHMIRFELDNDSLFFLTLRNFLTRFKFSTATGMDFKQVLEQTTGKDFTVFFDQWYFGEGYPIYDMQYRHLKDTLYVVSSQKSSANYDSFFRMKMELAISDGNKDTTVVFYQKHAIEQFMIPYKKPVDHINLDPHKRTFEYAYTSVFSIPDSRNHSADFMIFPNPVHDRIYIQSMEKTINPMSLRLCDLTGKIILNRKSLSSNTEILDLNILNPGIYFLIINTPNGDYKRRIVKL